jgi:predicted unusual protein kinase regulating ubiquinone biosynthesis (AarF/ABC1/UbiB family)
MNVGLKELSGAFHVPKDFVLLERTLLLLYGCCTLLDPALNPMAIIQPYLQDFVFGNRDWRQIAIEAIRETAMSAVTLPEDLRKYVTRAMRGDLEVGVKGVQEAARSVYAVGRQVIYTAIGIACGTAALQLHFRGEEQYAKGCVVVACVMGGLLLLSSIFARPRSGRWR